ncbi:hypothetical protein [Halohasta litorea]|uniref:CARDB domain-containing protein n=1 Tax=Halohasta litorea TaxID=869891 RepID=A0ABD6DDU8_9EURY|nr:hypothetical protein [Halohasta litorea]
MATDRNWADSRFLRVTVVMLILGSGLFVSVQPGLATDPPIQISTNISPEDPKVGETVDIETTVSNIENSESRNVDVRYVYLRQSGNTIQRFDNAGTIGSGGSLSLPLSTTFDSIGQKQLEVVITASYSDDDSEVYTYRQPVSVDVTESDTRGDVQLTSTETSGNDIVTIQGDASNIGGTDVQSVLLSVADTDTVSPVAPNGEYFVGEIEASEFGTFELTADVESEAETIPVEMTYIVTDPNRDDERVTKTQQIAVETTDISQGSTQAAASSGEPPAGGRGGPGGLLGGLPVAEIGIVLALALLGATGYAVHRWRNP